MAAAPNGSPPESIHRAHDVLLRHTDLQFDFPRFELPQPPGWLIWLGHWLERLAPVFNILFWVVGAVALAAVLYYLGRYLIRLRFPEKLKVQDIRSAMEEWRPTMAQAQALLGDADTLANEGKYGEAVHLLLLRSIEDFERFRPRVVKRSHTAREIEQLGAMPMTVRAAFAGIMEVVEKSLFGDYQVTRADWERCRAEYERFAFPDAWRSAA
jgi:hypothetical protein